MTDCLLYFSFRTPSSIIFLWIIGGIIFLSLLVMIYRQFVQRRHLENELQEIDKMLQANVEYEFVIKAMHLATWHLDPKMRSVTFDNDFRNDNDNYIPEAGTNIDDWVLQILPGDQDRVRKALDDLCQGGVDTFYQQYQVKSVLQGKT